MGFSSRWRGLNDSIKLTGEKGLKVQDKRVRQTEKNSQEKPDGFVFEVFNV